jgi:hypothetical protein
MMKQSDARLGLVPHFDVTTIDGRRVHYADIWQRKNLVLILVTPQEREAGARYACELQARRDDFERAETTVVVTTDGVPRLEAPAALVADRWGEIAFREPPSAGQTFRWPDADELLSWVHFVEIQCPECPP